MSSVPCRTCTAKTATIWAQCSLPDLNNVPLPDLNCDLLCSVFPAGPQPRDRMSEDMSERMSEDMSERMSDRTSGDMPERVSEEMSERMSEE